MRRLCARGRAQGAGLDRPARCAGAEDDKRRALVGRGGAAGRRRTRIGSTVLGWGHEVRMARHEHMRQKIRLYTTNDFL